MQSPSPLPAPEPARQPGVSRPAPAAGAGLAHALGRRLETAARALLLAVLLFVVLVIPWFFGGMGPEGYWFAVWAGRACLAALGLWGVSNLLLRRAPGAGFWVALACWALLGLQVWTSLQNPAAAPLPPWEGPGTRPLPFNPLLPTTVALWQTPSEALLWLSYGLVALACWSVGLGPGALRLLAWALVANTAALAAVGIPFKYSGNYLLLGRWAMPENYFFSSFTYHNHWCAFALLGLAACIGLFHVSRSLWQRALLAVLGAVIAVSAPVSVSRLGTLFVAAFLCTAFAFLLWRRWASGVLEWRRLRLPLLVGFLTLVLAGALVSFLNIKGPGSVGQRSWSYIIGKNPFGARLMIVEDALPMVRERPWFGWGLGSFGTAFRQYQRPETIIVYNQGRVTRYEHCHNDWMERLVELGFVGCFFAITPALFWWRRRSPESRHSPLANWLLCGVCFLALFSLGDMAFVNRSVALCGLVLFSLSTGLQRRSN